MHKIIWTKKKKEKAIEMLTKYFEIHGTGECIAQDDSAQIEAIELMCDISDKVLINNEGIVYNEED